MTSITPRLNRKIKGRPTKFKAAKRVIPVKKAQGLVEKALSRWQAPDSATAEKWLAKTQSAFPDQFGPESHWDEAVGIEWNNFFTWGHDHNFGFDVKRTGAMSTRHIEIASECMAYGMLPKSLAGKDVLDIGCWTGGDLLMLAGLGAKSVTAMEAHPDSAKAARHLTKIVGCNTDIVTSDAYRDRKAWKNKFDVIYCSGVVYHVTDPILLLRICFAYLKVGGRLIIETKSTTGPGSQCSFSGSREKGWNWYAPNRQALGRWFADVGFLIDDIELQTRPNGRLLGAAIKKKKSTMPDSTGFSRPGSWLEEKL